MRPQSVITNIVETLQILRNEEEVAELRILKGRSIYSGYFNDYEALANAAAEEDGYADGIYVTLNPVRQELLARANNRLQKQVKQATADADIERRNWLPIDFDPVRPSGISSTDKEHNAALTLANEVRSFLNAQGWAEPILADSGNGAHLLYYIDLPNDDASLELVNSALRVLDLKFSDQQVKVDSGNGNAARIWKLYGTKACKGDHTEERPHRTSEILEYPEELTNVTPEQMRELASQCPSLSEPPKPAKSKNGNGSDKSFDLAVWLDRYGLTISKQGTWQGNATKFVLEKCPWNSDHADLSAYVVQFKNGGIAAGCHHESCKSENWHTLRDLFEPDRNTPSESEGDESQSDILIRLGSVARFFRNDLDEAYAEIEVDGHLEKWKVKSEMFKNWLIHKFYNETQKAPAKEAMNQALSVMMMKGVFEGIQSELSLRVATCGEDFFYDLADKSWRAVRISPDGCEVMEQPPALFERKQNTKAQVEPDFNGNVSKLLDHVRIKDRDDQILFLVYIVSCLIPGIPHPVIVFCGEKGASKSTSMRMVRSIVDPAKKDMYIMPNGTHELAIILANNYMPSFDNLDRLSPAISDMLCTAVTGGGFSKRTLYTDDSETILSYKRCAGLNGINVVVTRPDLLDRSVIIELDRIPENERKEERVVWELFDQDKPDILGGAMQVLAKAMQVYPTVEVHGLSRMADFTRWGYAIAESSGLGGENFLRAYRRNQQKANEEALSSHPVAASVVALMRSHNEWIGTVAELLVELEDVAEQERIQTNQKTWPKAAHVLSRRLKEVQSNLADVGITFDIRHGGVAKVITIQRDGVLEANEKPQKVIVSTPPTQKVIKRPKLSSSSQTTDVKSLFEEE